MTSGAGRGPAPQARVTTTAHAADQMENRGIARSWVEAVLSAPERTEPDPRSGRIRLYRAIPEFGGRILRVVVETKDADVEVVTARVDRGATRRSGRR
jgi:Domain of unknown function (DUF4258)